MKTRNKLAIMAAFVLTMGCGGASSEQTKAQEAAAEKAVIDSVTTAVNASIETLETETKATTNSIDSLLSDI
ncbi:MAG: hypothetical protein RIB86_06855 [Imperialibacter sp.]|uniref:hypothetical protein n=1 Tax=Imperialibacter sp. TaxID=2038411 RepID=UPI0032EBB41E